MFPTKTLSYTTPRVNPRYKNQTTTTLLSAVVSVPSTVVGTSSTQHATDRLSEHCQTMAWSGMQRALRLGPVSCPFVPELWGTPKAVQASGSTDTALPPCRRACLSAYLRVCVLHPSTGHRYPVQPVSIPCIIWISGQLDTSTAGEKLRVKTILVQLSHDNTGNLRDKVCSWT